MFYRLGIHIICGRNGGNGKNLDRVDMKYSAIFVFFVQSVFINGDILSIDDCWGLVTESLHYTCLESFPREVIPV